MTWRILCSAGVAFGLVSFGFAQIGTASAIEGALKVVPKGGLGTKKPLEPSGFPTLPAKEGQLPPPRPFGEEEKIFQILQSEKSQNRGRRVIASGGVHARYKGYDLFGSTLEGDHDAEIYTLTGDVKVIGQDAVVTGRKVTVFMKTNSFIAEDAETQLSPTFLKGRVKDNVYTTGRILEGSEREIHSHDGGITTCNLDHPHFRIHADYTTVRPTKRIILRRVKIELFGKKLIELPFLSIPLDQRDRYLPEVGQSPDEGYFIKFKYPIQLKGDNNLLNARFEYMTKLGTGLGLDFLYDNPNMRGNMKVWGLFGTNNKSFEVVNQHSQRFGNLEISVSNNFQRQSYLLAPQNTILSSQVNLTLQQSTGQSDFSYYRSSNDGESFKYLQQTLSLSDTRQFGRLTRTNFNVTYTSNGSSFAGGEDISREQVDLEFRGSHELKAGTAELEYRRSIPVGEVENFFGSSDRTPVLSFRSDTARLLGNRFSGLPVQINMSLGEYTQPGQEVERLSRGALELAFSKSTGQNRRLSMDISGSLKQAVYSDGTAQYINGFNGGARYRLGRTTGLNFRYSYLEPHGFTPFQFDRTGEYNLATADLSFEPVRNLQIGAQTGYDFRQEQLQQTAWQSLGFRTEWTPASWFKLRGLSTYDTFSKAWSNVRLDLAYNPGDTSIGIGARYDGFRHTWGNVNVFVDGFKWGRLKTSAILVYNGYLKQFEARHFSFTYDLHCAEAIFQIIDNPLGFRPGTQFSFFIRLKAFPFDTPFGTGRRGQSFGTGTGYGF